MSKGQRERFSRPEEIAASRATALKSLAEKKIKVFGGRSHGNGMPATASEAEMFRRLKGEGFEREVVVTTGWKKPGLPHHYKLDLANVSRKIALELDGSSHRRPSRRASDARKDKLLRSKGWRVLRFPEPFDFNAMERACRFLLE
jgi:very-short-patch-repair endonuclease